MGPPPPTPLQARAVAAAVSAAASAGLPADDPVLVGTGSNAIVHLRPAPVVARVMTGTVLLHDDPHEWLARELAVGRHLTAAGAPIVGPTTLADPGPYEVDGLWLSLWDFAKVVPEAPTAAAIGATLAEVHAALATFTGELEPLDPIGEVDRVIAGLVGRPWPGPEALERLQRARDRAHERFAALGEEVQPLHADVSFSNLLMTSAGPRWNDLEDVCTGPLAWDVGGIAEQARERHGEGFADTLLHAYGRRFEPEELRAVGAVHHLYGAAWLCHMGADDPAVRPRATARLAAL